jgi:hypothetical protein
MMHRVRYALQIQWTLRSPWLWLVGAALLLSGCSVLGGYTGWAVQLVSIGVAALLGACIPQVDSGAVPERHFYVADFDVSSLLPINGGDGSNGFVLRDSSPSRTGQSVAVGDLNGDGFADIAVGSPLVAWGGFTAAGQVSILMGSAKAYAPGVDIYSIGPTAGRFWLGTATDNRTGTSVAIVRSVNNDSLPDLVVGSPNTTGGYGSAAVIFGASTLPGSQTMDATLLNGTSGSLLTTVTTSTMAGNSMAGGDINGDGIGDIAFGAPETILGGFNAGRLYHLTGSTGAWTASYAMGGGLRVNRFNGQTLDGSFGFSMAGGRDLDGDGFDDIVASARYDSGSWKMWAHFGSAASNQYATITSVTGDFRLDPAEPNDENAYSVAMGDVNGDGRADMIAGVALGNRFVGSYIPADTDTGRVHVVFGSAALKSAFCMPATNLNGTNGFTLVGSQPSEFLGSTVASGDINGDGVDDLIISSYPTPLVSPVVYVVFGKTGGWSALTHMSLLSSSEMLVLHSFGYGGAGGASMRSIAIGDVDGDGQNDLVLGWPNADSNRGRVFVIFNKALQN